MLTCGAGKADDIVIQLFVDDTLETSSRIVSKAAASATFRTA